MIQKPQKETKQAKEKFTPQKHTTKKKHKKSITNFEGVIGHTE